MGDLVKTLLIIVAIVAAIAGAAFGTYELIQYLKKRAKTKLSETIAAADINTANANAKLAPILDFAKSFLETAEKSKAIKELVTDVSNDLTEEFKRSYYSSARKELEVKTSVTVKTEKICWRKKSFIAGKEAYYSRIGWPSPSGLNELYGVAKAISSLIEQSVKAKFEKKCSVTLSAEQLDVAFYPYLEESVSFNLTVGPVPNPNYKGN
ncbi:MAG: hypothetical protein J5762_07530 [Clostridia bacterium]|nr:hypothetical protein [Clostridia bacterium]